MANEVRSVDVNIAFEGEPRPDRSKRLEDLRAKLASDDLVAVSEKRKVTGKGDLTVAIQLASLALSAIGTLISVLTYWRRSSRPDDAKSESTIILAYNDNRVTLRADHDPAELAQALHLEKAGEGTELQVIVKE